MEKNFIPVCEPLLGGNEKKYVDDCVSTGWISSSGKYVTDFEKAFCNYCGVKYGVAVCNGTIAIHLALVSLGIKTGDEVIIPNFTMIATAFAVVYTGAKPVFVDASPFDWNIDVDKIEQKITPKTKCIIPVSIFGHPCDMDPIKKLCKEHNLFLLEDAAESHGAEYKGVKTGALADITAFSFFANKNLTTGEGGMVVTDNEILYNRCKYFKNVCFPITGPRNYMHNDVGFNYRMSNIHAAIGLAQVEKADYYVDKRIEHSKMYHDILDGVEGITLQGTRPNVKHAVWMNGVVLNSSVYGRTRDELLSFLRENGIETRLFFIGMNKQPSLINYGCDGSGMYPVTDMLSSCGFYLPSSSSLSASDIEYICSMIVKFKK